MSPITRLLSVPAVLALVAGFGLVASVPASAKLNTKSSFTIISFDKTFIAGLKAQGIEISAIAPATWNPARAEIRFPVIKVEASGIYHSGSMLIGGYGADVFFSDPTILTPAGATEYSVTVSSAVGVIPLLVLKNPKPSVQCKVDGAHMRWVKRTTTQVQGSVRFSSDASAIALIQSVVYGGVGNDFFRGAGRVTLVDDINSKTKPKC